MRRSNSRPALGLAVNVRLDQDTHNKLIEAKMRSGRSKSMEIVLRVRDHLERYPKFFIQAGNESNQLGPCVLARFDKETNNKLVAAKNRSNRSKTYEVFLRVQDHLKKFPYFYNSETVEEMQNCNF
ncbi:TraY domain-containing protein [Gibbsiella quercinecans]|uniref:TraY domain-containing protein n=1 Tax=Gibbsiella quercinecans TaxID=929813 RepID=UPI000EF1F495|nr:TraY domain-containing protein [Gibbsiella quercinecans]